LSDRIYREYLPPPRLAGVVECFWTSSVRADTPAHRVLPDGCVDLLFAEDRGLQIVGAMTRPRVFDLPAGARFVAARLRPAASAAMFGIPGRLTMDRAVPWPGPGALEQQLGDVSGDVARVRLLASALPEKGREAVVDRVAAWMADLRGQVDMDKAARLSGVSARQLRRLFLERVGLSPKHLCRILRFRRAVALARRHSPSPGYGWAAIAAACGYYDQAHLIRDFHEFAGLAPDEWRMSVFSNTNGRPVSYHDGHEDHAHSVCRRD
jgi:AraC-like DNA-binding protein